MADNIQLLEDLAVVMGTAGVTALLFQKLRLPVLFGFLGAGLIIGPHNPFFTLLEDEQSLQTLADLGVVLLLFGLGLSFNFRQLRRVGGVAFVVTVVQGLLMLWLGYALGHWIGWSRLDNLFLGAMLSISSTTITIKVLRDLGRLHEPSSQIIFGVLIFQDIAAILVLVLLSGYIATGGVQLANAGIVLVQMALFLVATVLLGLLLIPRLVDWVARHHGNEVLVITVLGLAFGYAVLSHLANFHVGLGAFLMGALVAESRQHERVEQTLRPVSDMFTAIFFVSVGTLVDVSVVRDYWKPLVALVLLIVLGKLLSGWIATFLMGHAPGVAFATGVGLAQIGEFSFVIAALGRDANVISPFLFPLIVAVSALTLLVAPLLIRHTEDVMRGLDRVAPAPLRTYAAVYVSWMSSFRTRSGPAQLARRTRARRTLILNGVVVTAALGAAWLFQEPGQSFFRNRNFTQTSTVLTYWGLVVALLLPLLFGFYQSVNRWVSSWEPKGSTVRTGLGVRRVVQYTFYLLGAIVLGGPVLTATSPLLATPVVAIAWGTMVGSAALILWASIRRLHSRIESNVQSLLDDEHVPVRAPQVVRDLMASEFPWPLKVEVFELRAGSWAAGKRLGEVGLRSVTGASLILGERDDRRDTSPGPDTMLLPGDRLTLIGTQEQLTSARAVLSKPAPKLPQAPELRLGRLFVSEQSPLDGIRLSEASLPSRSGLQVVAIVRDNKAIPNPGANEKLRAGDVLLVLGPQERIAAATALTRTPSERGGGPAGTTSTT